MSLFDAGVVSKNFGEFRKKLAFAVLHDESQDLRKMVYTNLLTDVVGHGKHDGGVKNVRKTCFV
jgi:hypothetical protein